MERSIQEVARLAGTSSRTLRHYDSIGLLRPTRVAENGYRYYDDEALLLLQRILLLRQLGLALTEIANVIGETELTEPADDPPRPEQADRTRPRTADVRPRANSAVAAEHELAVDSARRRRRETAALAKHLVWIRAEQERLERQARAVEKTMESLTKGEELVAEEMFDGFDHTQYKTEVEDRWGKQAYVASDTWWRSKSDAEKSEFQQQHREIARDYAAAHGAGAKVAGDEVQAIVQRHWDWLNLSAPATGPLSRERFLGLGDMYVADPRFAANYGGQQGAEFVRDAMRIYADRNLEPKNHRTNE